MALNQTAYTVNPSKSLTAGVKVDVSTVGATATLYTVAAGEAKKVSGFAITANCTGTAGTDFTEITLKIGNSEFSFVFDSALAPGTSTTVTSVATGFTPAFLQVADTITVTHAKHGAPVGNISFSVTLDAYEI